MTPARLAAFLTVAFVLAGCGYPFGEPWECNRIVDGCIIR